jgi:PAS domain S-box-containing protein
VLANRITNAVRQQRAEEEITRGFQAMETAREGISLLDEEGKFLYVNQAYADTYGYDRGELIGEHWEMLYPEEHVDLLYKEVLPSVPRDGRWQGEHTHLTKGGDRLIVDHALAYASTGTLICLIRDITEEKMVRRELEQERTRFELFVDAVEEYAIFSLDPEGYVTSWNTGAERIKGYEQEEIIGQHFSTFYPQEKAKAGYADELLVDAVEDGSVEDEGWRVCRDGSRFWANVVITAVRDENGTHSGFVKVTRDMTERYEARTEVADAEQFVDQAVDLLEDVFYVLDADGTIDRVSDRAVELTGYSREEMLEMEPPELFVPEDADRIRTHIQEALVAGNARVEAEVRTAAGRRIPCEFRTRRMTDDEDRVSLVGIGRDISDRKRRERQLKRQLQQFEQFASVLSHDMRTPLTTAKGRLELAAETGDREHFEGADAALDRLDELIADLADVMREGQLVTEFSTVEFGAVAETVWETLAAGDATLRVVDSVTVRADEDALARMLENLLKNALDHGGDDVTVTVGRERDTVFIEDDGPGIPTGELDSVFELGQSKKDGEETSGIGLASVRQIAVAHGWEISASAPEGGGAKFELTDVEFAN